MKGMVEHFNDKETFSCHTKVDCYYFAVYRSKAGNNNEA